MPQGPRLVVSSFVLLCVFAGLALVPTPARAQTPSDCITCHTKETPGIVTQFKAGKMGKSGLDCSLCHGSAHKTATDADKALIPTPDTCAACHSKQVAQFRAGKHELAWIAMQAMPGVAHMPPSISGPAGLKGCAGCHAIGEKPKDQLASFSYGTASCDACHTRHTFSKAEAQDPRACQTCHMGFDHPQYEMWSTSKHGTIWQIEGNTGRAPTCQTCHMANGEHGVITAWGFLALRVPEDDQAWWNDRVEILKALGVLDAKGNPTERLDLVKAGKVARLTKEEFTTLRAKEVNTCLPCHGKSFVAQQFAASEDVIKQSDQLFAQAIRTVQRLYEDGYLTKPADWKYAPDLLQFEEARSSVEQELWLMFQEYRARAIQGAFHNNPDYTQWYGWAQMKHSLRLIQEKDAELRATNKPK